MAFPSSITLNIGSPAADVVFSDKQPGTGNMETVYYAPSPDADLAGRRELRISHDKTRGGIVRSNVRFRFPKKDTVTGKYNRFITGSITLNRTEYETLASVDEVLEAVQEVCAVSGFRAAVGNMTVG